MNEEQATKRENGTAPSRGTHQFMAVTALVTCHIFDLIISLLEHMNQIGLVMSCSGREQVTDTMADEA